MGRKRTEINPIRGQRLRELLSELDIDQKELAETIGYSPEHISYVINGRRNLTQDAAESIAKAIPGVRVEWLMALDNFRTEKEYEEYPFAKTAVDKQFSKQAVEMLAATSGFRFKVTGSTGVTLSLDDVLGLSVEDRENIQRNLPKIRGDCAYCVERHGKKLFEMSIDDFNDLIGEVKDFVEFRILKIYERGEHNG